MRVQIVMPSSSRSAAPNIALRSGRACDHSAEIVLPVLPVVLTAGVSRRDIGLAADDSFQEWNRRRRSWRPYGVVAGLTLSFSVSALFGSLILSALHLPQDLLRNIGIAVLAVIGLGLLWLRLGDLLERPFTRLPQRQVNPDSNGVVLGLGLSLLFVPCAGPVLATIAVVGASQQISAGALVLTAAIGIGVGYRCWRSPAPARRSLDAPASQAATPAGCAPVGGVLMILTAAAIGLNRTDGLQRTVPGYSTLLQNILTSRATNQLHNLAGGGSSTTGTGPTCDQAATRCTTAGPRPN